MMPIARSLTSGSLRFSSGTHGRPYMAPNLWLWLWHWAKRYDVTEPSTHVSYMVCNGHGRKI